jgi:hypothetical protein
MHIHHIHCTVMHSIACASLYLYCLYVVLLSWRPLYILLFAATSMTKTCVLLQQHYWIDWMLSNSFQTKNSSSDIIQVVLITSNSMRWRNKRNAVQRLAMYVYSCETKSALNELCQSRIAIPSAELLLLDS